MATIHCTRSGCNRVLPKGRHKYCGKECAALAQQEQLKAITVKRREQRKLKPPVNCAIPGCSGTLRPVSSSHKYCSIACSLKGLEMAIERQRKARQELKKVRQEERRIKKAKTLAKLSKT